MRMSKHLEYVNCNLCASEDHKTLEVFTSSDLENVNKSLVSLRKKPLYVPKNQFYVVKCKNCGLVFLNPRLNKGALKIFYESFYSKLLKGKNVSFESSVYSSINLSQEKGRLKEIQNLNPLAKKILDIGAGPGHFLSVAKKEGWKVYGQEYSKAASRIAKREFGIHIYVGEIDNLPYPDNFFDIVTMHSVIEHTIDPSKYLQIARRKLKPGGMVVFSVPNLYCFDYLSSKLLILSYPGFIFEHLYYFSKKTVSAFLKKTDLQLICLTSKHHSRPNLPEVNNFPSNNFGPNKLELFFDQLTKSKDKSLYIRMRIYLFASRLAKEFLEYNHYGGMLKLGSIFYVFAQKPIRENQK